MIKYKVTLPLIVLGVSCVDTGANKTRSDNNSNAQSVRHWYEGGSLHTKTALDWQKATYPDKLATCSDFVAYLWRNGDFNDSISDKLTTIDNLRPLAHELVEFLDATFKTEPDPERNRVLFTNQTVAGTATLGVVMMGWTKI